MKTTNRYRFTALHTYAGHTDRRYRVTRTTDGKVLGTVSRHYYGAGRPYWEIHCDAPENGYHYDSRAEAADALDAADLMGETCACGMPVGEHDRPTRIAMRAYTNSTADLWHHRSDEAESAFREALPKDKRYTIDDVRDAGSHAHQYAQPHIGNDVHLVQMSGENRLSVTLRINYSDSGVGAIYWINGRQADHESFGSHLDDPAATLAEQIPDFEARGYVRSYDWSN